MKRGRSFLAAALAAVLLSTGPAMAWETPTHVGLAEQAADRKSVV